MKRELWRLEAAYAVVEDGRLVEYIDRGREPAFGAVLLGKVSRMMSSLSAAFVEIGRAKAGFLPFRENSTSFTGGELRPGDSVAVQIRREENGGKGAFLTRDITLPGMFTIVMPMNRHIGVSARVTDEGTRERLKQLGQRTAAGRYGLVMRAAAAEAEEADILREAEALAGEWEKTCGVIPEKRAPCELIPGSDPWSALLRDYLPKGVDVIRTETGDDGAGLPDGITVEKLTAGEMSDMRRQLSQADARVVRLPHGGNIVVDRCEAMTVIDVNTAGDTGARLGENIFMRTDLEACREIAVQTRLRNLGGIILADMIDLKTDEDRGRIIAEMREAFANDRVKTVIHGFTSLGILEMTRKRGDCAARQPAVPESGCGEPAAESGAADGCAGVDG